MSHESAPDQATTSDPDWDLSSFFPSAESSEFVEASRLLNRDLTRWEEAA
jgi:hypothetical protein